MDKNILKKFAIESRKELTEKIETKIKKFFVDEEFKVVINGDIYSLVNEKHTLILTKREYDDRCLLIKRIKEITLEQVIEEAAYTWFNRIIAIRYMEIHDYLPLTKDNQSLGIRVLSSRDNHPDPEIMKFSNLTNSELDIDLNKSYYMTLRDDNKKFEYILLLICKKLGKVIPQVFDGVTDYIDLLIPDNLLNESGYITKVLRDVPEENYNDVEIIGWLYQYYNQTEKDRVISAKKVYKKNEIPFATQLFTPDWIVKYMVENSLGKFWIEHGGNKNLINNWKYYIKTENEELKEKVDPKEIKCIDPCSGSGHILIYMFEILYQIYESYGYSKNDIVEFILENNLYGLDIDDRAGQLSILSVILKAREYDKRIFNKKIIQNLNVMSIQESNGLNKDVLDIIKSNEEDIEGYTLNETIDYIYENFENAKEIGSLLILDNKDYNQVIEKINKLTNEQLNIFDIEKQNTINEKYLPLILNAKLLTQKYEVVVTNPPYMNKGLMSENLKKYIFDKYNKYKTDISACFIIKEVNLLKSDGYVGLMTPNVLLYISSFEELREEILNKASINSLIKLSNGCFFKEATVDIVTFILSLNKINKSIFVSLDKKNSNIDEQEKLFEEAISQRKQNQFFVLEQDLFFNIPGKNFAFWLPPEILKTFSNVNIGDITFPKAGVVTGSDKDFIRNWYEVNFDDICFEIKEKGDFGKYYVFQKGGDYRRWFGNNEYVIALKKLYDPAFYNSSIRKGDKDFYFKEGIGWSQIGSNKEKSFRMIKNAVCGTATPMLYLKNEKYKNYLLGLLNTKYAELLINTLNPTLKLHANEVAKIPFIINEDELEEIDKLVKDNIELCKLEWDLYETSWEFCKHPLMPSCNYYEKLENCISNIYNLWEIFINNQFEILKKNEENLNKKIIKNYEIQEELNYVIKDKDITIRKANKEREIKSLISYAVGCMFGRYSLDQEGLVYAGGEFDESKYKIFKADKDNVLPITDEAYFGDDIVSKFKKFIEIVYGKETLNDNMNFIAETLGKKNDETDEDTIRRYFINDFYNDHIKMYQKKPIYWLFDSGKKNGFKCLIYMHRYDEQTVAKIRLDYLHRMQNTYEKMLQNVEYKLQEELSIQDKKDLLKKQSELTAKLQETNEYDERIAHIANQRINIDLDDGVTVNYNKFVYKNPKTGKEESVLGKIK